jgi:hypothetical protein
VSTQTPKPWKIDRPHSPDCCARGAYTVLVEPEHTLFLNRFANKAPSGRGEHHLYLRVKCNDPRCPSTAVFHLYTALVAVGLNDAD